jgi:integrase
MPRKNKGPHLEQNKGGIWEVRWTEQGGRSRRVSTRSKDRNEATRFLAGFILELEKENDRTLTTGGIIDRYIAEHVENGPVIDKGRQRRIAFNLKGYFEDMRADQIGQQQISDYGRLRSVGKVGSGRARSSGTLRRELNMLKAALHHAAKTKRITLADIPYIPMPTAPGAKDLWLTEIEADQFVDASKECSERARLFVAIAINTASRRAAIETLRWEQIDLDHRLISFNPQGRAQSRKRRVPVPINAALLAELLRVPAENRVGFVLGHAGGITRHLETVCRKATANTGNRKFMSVTPHTLRHTWATLAARSGVDPYMIAGILGDTLATVQNNYLHHCPDHLRGAVNFRERKAA